MAALDDKIVTVGGGEAYFPIYDEDTMSSDDNRGLATQQSIKAYVDEAITGGSMVLDAGLTEPSIVTGVYQSLADGGVILSTANPYNAAFLADDSGDDIGDSVRNVLVRTLLTVDQAAGSIRSLMGQLKLLDGVDLSTGVYAAVQGYIELAGDTSIKSGAKASGLDISIEIPTSKTLTIDSGAVFAGLKIETTGAGR